MASPEEKLKKLQALLKIVDESVTKDEFVKAFKNVVDFVQAIKAQNEKEISLMQENIRLLGAKLSNSSHADLTSFQAQIAAQVDAKLASVKDGKDGKDGQDGVDGEDGQDGKDADETTLLAQISALRDELEARLGQFEAQSNESAAKGTPVVYGPGKTKLIVLDLSPQLDGSTKTFQLGTNFGIVSVSSSSAPFGAFRPVIDYNGVGKTIVFTDSVDAPSALATGQSLIITYLK